MTVVQPAVRVCIRLIGPLIVVAVALALLAGAGSAPAVVAYVALGVLLACVIAYYLLVTRSDRFHAAEIARGLERACRRDLLEETVDVDALRMVVVSDMHRGTRDGADDFWRSERAYGAALGYYLEGGYRLVVLGDAEELWECRPGEVIEHYGEVLALEARFHADDRYVRVWGNHDDDWAKERLVAAHLHPRYDSKLRVREGLRIRVTEHGQPLGTLVLLHGHQGTWDSEVFNAYGRRIVRVFGSLQRRFNKPWNTPATDFKLRARHDRAMYLWARGRRSDGIVLIAGHTHRPVFWHSAPEVPTDEQIAALEAELEQVGDRQRRRELQARLQYLLAERRYLVGLPTPIEPPCYFNTGCCSFADGDITGLQISNGQMRLVRFPADDSAAPPKCLDCASLRDVLARVRSPGGRESAAPPAASPTA